MPEIEVERGTVNENNGYDGPSVLLFGGKGGVGKTTCASSAGLRLAREYDQRTVIVSTDPAHSLSDAFGDEVEVGDSPTEIEENLYGVEVNPKNHFESRYSDSFKKIINYAKSFGVDVEEGDLDDIASQGIIPGADELAVIDLFSEYLQTDEWDYVVFDTAPTGHTIRLLQAPGVAGSTIKKIYKMKSSFSSVTSKVKGVFSRGEKEQEEEVDVDLSEEVEDLSERLELVGNVLQDDERTQFHVVTLPESMPLSETSRLLEQLDDEQISVGSILANKVLVDPNTECERCMSQSSEQQRLLDGADEEFEPPVIRLPEVFDPETPEERLVEISQHIPLNIVEEQQ